jgi:Ca2+-binding RTX toxin-like protein
MRHTRRSFTAVGVAVALGLVGLLVASAAATGPTQHRQLTCEGKAVTIEGTPGPDTLVGTEGPDVLDGGIGADTIEGGGGSDTICGGIDNDILHGGPGDDTINGGVGADTIQGGDGNDTIQGGTDPDTIDGGNGNDTIDGGVGADTIQGGDGNDTIQGGTDPDTIDGGNGNDTIDGGTGADTITCGPGVDSLSREPVDILAPGSGCETPPAPPPPRKPSPRPHRGRTVVGTARNDVLKGTPGPDKLFGKGGNDKLYGYGGNDRLTGGPGADRLVCGAGRDTAIADRQDKVARDCEVVKGLRKPKPKPKPPPPPPAQRTIKTTVGTLRITDVTLADRFPPGCTLGTAFCDRAPTGRQVLVVWLARTDGGSASDLADKLDAASRGAYVLGSDGSRGDRYAEGLLSGRLLVAFTPPASARGFRLFWPGNPPVPLGK